tara:strand:+ start:3034 stop:3663 length:630 start_codon:yes stop_codon:yes gene_type:complete
MGDIVNQSVYNKSRVDKFILAFTTPACLQGISSDNQRATEHKSYQKVMPKKMQFSIHGAVVPAINIPPIEVPKYGQTLKVSSHTRSPYEDVQVQFTVDNQFNNYWYIWRWLDIITSAKTSEYDPHNQGGAHELGSQRGRLEMQPPGLLLDYASDFTMYALNEYNKETVSFLYKQAFPISLGNINYDYRSENEIDCSFTFAFTQLLVTLL